MNNIGMTSITFRNLAYNEVIEITKNAGLNGIEWGGDVHVLPGKLDAAYRIGEETRANGLKVLSYGSYFKAGENGQDSLERINQVIQTAKALKTQDIRIWFKQKPGIDYDLHEYNALISEVKLIAGAAKDNGVILSFEYHGGTYNDSAVNCIKMLNDVGSDSIRTYWQPIHGYAVNMKEVALLQSCITNVHVYNWIYGEKTIRLLLEEGIKEWQDYISILKSGNHNYILEFCKDDDGDNFLKDAKTLKSLISSTKA